MKQRQSGEAPGPSFPTEETEPPFLWEDKLSALLADFPDPVLVTDRQGKVAFLNGAATELFGDTLRAGDTCTLCSRISGLPSRPDGGLWRQTCSLKMGESLKRVPILLKARADTTTPLTVTATPIRSRPGEGPAGCFVVFRDLYTDLLAHPVVELQTAMLSHIPSVDTGLARFVSAVQFQTAALSSIIGHFPMPFFTVDPDLVITHVNEHMERLSGYTREQMVGKKTCAQVLRTPKCGTPECLLKQVMESKKPVSGRREVIQNRQNREIQVEISASMITDFAGRVIGGFEAILDVTPMVEAQRKIDQLIELTQAGILMVDENQRILFANSRVAEFLQTSRQELFGKSLGKVLTRQHVRIARELSQMLEQGQQKDLQFCGPLNKRHPQEGESRYFETTMAISRLGKSAITYISLWDLTEHIKLENELIKANNFLNNIIRCSVDGIVVLDTKGNPLLFNEGAEHILGYKAEEVIGHQEVLHKIYDRKFAADMMRRMRSDEYGPRDKLNSTRLTFVNKEGEEVPVNFSASIIRERGREVGSVGIFSDQRERVKMRKKLEESQAQLMQSEKIASLGRLAAGVAHEINNPLAGILIYAELLQLDLEEKAETSQKVAEIIDQTLRCKQIVTRLLEFSRQSLGDRTLFNLNEMISRCVDLISHQALIHNIEIVQHLDPELPQIVGDPGQLQQVVTNLLLNAADAIHGRGRITIASQAAPQGEGVILTFTDTGRGIPQEIRNKIFEPFFTTKPPGKGTGLGLSIVYGVIQRHGGSIQVDSSPGEGTTFTLKLPLDSPQEGSPIL